MAANDTRKRCLDCALRYAVGRSPRCNPCRKKQARDRKHNTHLKGTYGIDITEYYAMLQAQDGTCAICDGGTSKKYLQCDHNHKTGEVRGLLCATCNKRLLTAAKDDTAILYKAIDYLDDPPARRVLGGRTWTDYADEKYRATVLPR